MLRYVALVAAIFAGVVSAQVNGSITGSVNDQSGSAVAGATVRLTSEATGAVQTATTNADGDFSFTAVLPGMYTVVAERTGFKRFQKEHIELTPGAKLAVGSLPLSVGEVSESVTVQAEGAMLQTASSERAGLVTSEEVKDLTVINRDFTSFAELQPGVVINQGVSVQTFSGGNSFNVNGGRSTNNNIMIDGLPVLNTNQGNPNTTISLDNTQTIEVKTANFAAEFGRNNGFHIMAVSKQGSQKIHGATYYYDRNEAFNANNFFNNRSGTPQTPLRINYIGGSLGGPLRVPGIGATRRKLFFQISVESIKELRPKGQVNVTVPTLLERKGDFSQSGANAKPIASGGTPVTIKDPTTGVASPGNVIPANRIIPSMQNYLNLLPAPNALDYAVTRGAYNYSYQESLHVPKWLNSARLDYNASEKTQLFARFNYWYEDQQGSAVSASNTSWGWLKQHYTAITPSGVISATHIFSPTVVFQATMGYSQFSEAGPPLTEQELAGRQRSQVGFTIPQLFPSINEFNLVPTATFGVSNSANPSYASRFPLQGVENTFNWSASLSKVWNNHTFKIGAYPEHWLAMKGKNASAAAGSMNYSQDSNNPIDTGYAYSNALLGALNQYTESSNRYPMYEYNTTIEWYLQDSWKVSRKLTLDLGLRWGWGTPWHGPVYQEAAFVPSTFNFSQVVKLIQPTLSGGKRLGLDPYTGAILPALTIGAIAPEAPNPLNGIVNRATNPNYPQGMRNTDGVKTAPRVGFAWDPFGRGKTVIRGGGGLFYNFHDVDNWSYGYQYSTPPLQYNPVIYYNYLTQIGQAQGYNFPNNVVGFDSDRKIQKTYNFSFGFQQDVHFGTVIDVAYVGALSRHLVMRKDLNTTPLGANYQASNLDATNGNKVLPTQFLRPYQGWGSILYYFPGGNSSYHSLQTAVRRRYKQNMTYGVVWTWSKTMDYTDTETNSASTTVSSVINPKAWNYGIAGYDHTHILVAYWNYNLPKVSALAGRNKVVASVFDNWQMSGKYKAQSGVPLGVSYSYSPSTDITGSTDSGRVLVVADPVLPKDQRTFNQAFNTSAFVAPPPAACQNANPSFLCWGNAAKALFRGPGINDWDMSLFKNMPFAEGRVKAQLRVEAYNVFNHTQFTGVGTSATFNPTTGAQTNGTFGQYTSAANARQLQLALRISF
ncbi:MAG TPA: TonB-dependent receptor [Candidatus Solibacter sp.]|nr:TonB-dependent receptor [Candidatus Solibacter sp.]